MYRNQNGFLGTFLGSPTRYFKKSIMLDLLTRAITQRITFPAEIPGVRECFVKKLNRNISVSKKKKKKLCRVFFTQEI